LPEIWTSQRLRPEGEIITRRRFVRPSPSLLRAAVWRTLLACMACPVLAATIAAAELPVAVPRATESALAQMRDGNVHWAAAHVLALAIPLFFLFTGLAARLRQLCDRISGRRLFLTVTLFACAYLFLGGLIVMPFDFYVDYVLPHAARHSDQSLPSWLTGESVQLAVRLIAAALLIWLPYRLIARSPRRWWLYCAAALIPFAFLALVALPVWVAPLTTSYKPLSDHALEMKIKSLAARCGVASLPVFVGGNDTTVVGLGPTNRIVLQSDLAQVETPEQIEFTVGHELKHYVMGDNWKALAIIAAILLVGFWLTDRVGRAAIRRYSQRWGFSELSDPASFPLMAFMFTFIVLAILPFFNLFARHIELEADRFGLELTHKNHAAAMIFAKDAQTGLTPDWDRFFLITQATHPSIAARINFANNYKPWETGAPLAYGNICKSE
jgi:STE24 endopeptidase